MTRILYVGEDETLVLIDSPRRASEIIQAVAQGAWLAPTARPGGSQTALNAARVGSLVVITPREGPAPHITPRQRQILNGLAAGLTLRQMAARLGLAERTVRLQAALLKGKLGASTLPELVGAAVEMGLFIRD